MKVNYSVIIPQRGSIDTLPRLLNTIPLRDDIEIIIVDNSPIPIDKNQIGVNRDFILLWSPPEHFAGGARNVGLEQAKGKWLIFADADDYFADGAFDSFDRYLNSDVELVYFCVEGIYPETGESADRGYIYTKAVKDYLLGEKSETYMRLFNSVPWGKMIKRELVERHDIKFDEVIAANDVYFSLLVGYNAKKITADDHIVYVVTVSRGSLTRRRDFAVVFSRYKVALRYNRFIKEHRLGAYQKSVMVYFYNARPYGIIAMMKMFGLAIKYRQNIFIGASKWIDTLKKNDRLNKKESEYIIK